MLFLALVGMCFGILRRLIKKRGAADCAKERPADNGYYVRCPACGCPLGESRSLNAVEYKVTQSRAFRAGDSFPGDAPSGALRMGDECTPKSALRSACCSSKQSAASPSCDSQGKMEKMHE